MTTHSIYDRYREELGELERGGMMRRLRDARPSGTYIELDGRRLLNLSSNDYLGLASREAFARQIHEALAQWGGAGSTSSRLMTGNYPLYSELEGAMARRFGREAALVFGSGYHMNEGIVPALVRSGSVVLADRLVHASMIDGIRLSGAPFERFRHNDLEHLERLIRKHRERSPHIIVMVESIYSMDGDEADLRGLCALKRLYPEVMLYVDEAHAIGVRGESGLGLAEEMGTIGEIDLLLGTFGKALASMGGYLVCDEVVRQMLVNRCRSLIFSTALPPITTAYSLLSFSALPELGVERSRLRHSSEALRRALEALGLSTPSTSHIIPIIVGGAETAVRLSEALQDRGYYVLPIRPPSVPEGQCRLRLSLTSETPIEAFIEDFTQVWQAHSQSTI